MYGTEKLLSIKNVFNGLLVIFQKFKYCVDQSNHRWNPFERNYINIFYLHPSIWESLFSETDKIELDGRNVYWAR